MSAFDLAIVALGSNVGDSPGILRRAMERLAEISVQPLVKSSLWQTTPVDCPPGSPPFVNAVVALTPGEGETPESLLAKLLALEKEFGRRPKQVLNEPRRLDLDLIAFGQETRLTPGLTLPHPRAIERWLKGELKRVDRFEKWEAGEFERISDASLLARGQFLFQESIE